MTRLYLDDTATWQRVSCIWGRVSRYGPPEVGYTIGCHSWPREDGSEFPNLSFLFNFGALEEVFGEPPSRWLWWQDPAELPGFIAHVRSSKKWRTWGDRVARAVAVVADDGDLRYALFDCWGFRDPARPVVAMTEDEWVHSVDTGRMLRWFRQEWRGVEAGLNNLLLRFCLACCRRIWPLLPHPDSRWGIEVAERYTDGRATEEEFSEAKYVAEGAAFGFELRPSEEDFDAWVGEMQDPSRVEPPPFPETDLSDGGLDDDVTRWCQELARVPEAQIDAMLPSPRPEELREPLDLLRHAAFFADHAICYVGIRPKESIEKYRIFLSAPLLREVVGNPFRDRGPASGSITHT